MRDGIARRVSGGIRRSGGRRLYLKTKITDALSADTRMARCSRLCEPTDGPSRSQSGRSSCSHATESTTRS